MKLTTESGIYRITNVVTKAVYIGKAENIRVRISNHRSLLNKGKHPNRLLQAAWNEFGERSFRVRVLKKVTRDIDRHEKETLTRYLDEGIQVYNMQDLVPNIFCSTQ